MSTQNRGPKVDARQVSRRQFAARGLTGVGVGAVALGAPHRRRRCASLILSRMDSGQHQAT